VYRNRNGTGAFLLRHWKPEVSCRGWTVPDGQTGGSIEPTALLRPPAAAPGLRTRMGTGLSNTAGCVTRPTLPSEQPVGIEAHELERRAVLVVQELGRALPAPRRCIDTRCGIGHPPAVPDPMLVPRGGAGRPCSVLRHRDSGAGRDPFALLRLLDRMAEAAGKLTKVEASRSRERPRSEKQRPKSGALRRTIRHRGKSRRRGQEGPPIFACRKGELGHGLVHISDPCAPLGGPPGTDENVCASLAEGARDG
jgi:hypothetical protein